MEVAVSVFVCRVCLGGLGLGCQSFCTWRHTHRNIHKHTYSSKTHIKQIRPTDPNQLPSPPPFNSTPLPAPIQFIYKRTYLSRRFAPPPPPPAAALSVAAMVCVGGSRVWVGRSGVVSVGGTGVGIAAVVLPMPLLACCVCVCWFCVEWSGCGTERVGMDGRAGRGGGYYLFLPPGKWPATDQPPKQQRRQKKDKDAASVGVGAVLLQLLLLVPPRTRGSNKLRVGARFPSCVCCVVVGGGSTEGSPESIACRALCTMYRRVGGGITLHIHRHTAAAGKGGREARPPPCVAYVSETRRGRKRRVRASRNSAGVGLGDACGARQHTHALDCCLAPCLRSRWGRLHIMWVWASCS